MYVQSFHWFSIGCKLFSMSFNCPHELQRFSIFFNYYEWFQSTFNCCIDFQSIFNHFKCFSFVFHGLRCARMIFNGFQRFQSNLNDSIVVQSISNDLQWWWVVCNGLQSFLLILNLQWVTVESRWIHWKELVSLGILGGESEGRSLKTMCNHWASS